MKEKVNYEMVNIDPESLDIELLHLPTQIFKAGQQQAEYRQKMEILQDKLKYLQAELSNKIRKDPEEYGLSKVTESALLNTILERPEYKQLETAFLEARYEYELSKMLVSALDAKRSALDNLVKLFGLQYFAGPSVPLDITRKNERSSFEKSANEKVIRRRSKK